MTSGPYLKAILAKFRREREKRKIAAATIEEKLILGPGWIDRFERGDTVPTLDMLFAMLHSIGVTLGDIIEDLDVGEVPSEVERHIFAVPAGKDLDVHFRYANFDAVSASSTARLYSQIAAAVLLPYSLGQFVCTRGH